MPEMLSHLSKPEGNEGNDLSTSPNSEKYIIGSLRVLNSLLICSSIEVKQCSTYKLHISIFQ